MLSDKSKDFLNKDTQVVQNKYDHLYKNDKVTNGFPPNARILDFGFDTSLLGDNPPLVERAIAELHKAYEAAISELERKIRSMLRDYNNTMLRTKFDPPSAYEAATVKLVDKYTSLHDDYFTYSDLVIESTEGRHLLTGLVPFIPEKPTKDVENGNVFEFSMSFNYAAFEPTLMQAPAVKQIPKLLVGDEITWEFYVEGYTEKSVSIAIKSLDARSLMLRDGFIVDGISICRQSPYTKVGKVVLVRRADVVNGGHKIVYSNG